MKIILYARNIVTLDGVGNSVIDFETKLKNFYSTSLVSIYSDKKDVINFQDYLGNHDSRNILFYHFSIFDENLSEILNLKFKYKIIYFHGITAPNKLLDIRLKSECQKGLDQIKTISSFDLYFFNSSESKSQFINNSIIKASDKFYIMPPVEIKSRYINFESKFLKPIDRIINAYYLGSFGDHKKVDFLIDKLSRKNSKIQLNIFSSLIHEDIPKEYAKKLLNKQFKYYSRINDKEIIKYIKNMDFFISFSDHEGFCIPFFEAILLNKPPLVKKLNCFSDYLPKDYLYINEEMNEKDLIELFHLNYKTIFSTRRYILSILEETYANGLKTIRELL